MIRSRTQIDWRHIFVMLALMTSLLLLSVGPGGEQRALASASSKTSAELLEQFKTDSDGKVRYVVVLSEQANLSNDIRDWNAKGEYVLNALRSIANKTQPPVAALLDRQKGLGNVDTYKRYYIINGFSVLGNVASTQALEALPEVARIEAFPVITHDVPPSQKFGTLSTLPAALGTNIFEGLFAGIDSNLSLFQVPQGVEWNVAMVRAPQAWAMDCGGNPCNGAGVTVGSLDTGVRFTHVALVNKYRGNTGLGFDHNYNWWDAQAGLPVPYDDPVGHGTHTTGTMVGDDGLGNQVGVAPGANWIATNGIAAPAFDADIIEAGEWMLAPWNLSRQNPDPSKRPAVVGNSWGYGGSNFNCSSATFFRAVVQAWVAAGIFPSFSAGNAGATGNRPPAAYPETFETGSLTRSAQKSSFSSIGPSCFDGGQHPQIMAGGGGGLPIDWVRSSHSSSDASYAYLQGTSMAQPATAGAVAILKQANPNLTIQETWFILTSTAYMDPAWGTAPNSEYGWGMLQIDAAVRMAQEFAQRTPTPTVTGTPPTATPSNTPTPTATMLTPTPTATPACVNTYTSSDVPKLIPDLLTVQSTLNIQNGPFISTLEVVGLSFTHTYPEDLNVYLISPSGTRVKLFSDVCGGGDWTVFQGGFNLSDGAATSIGATCPPGTGTYRPHQALSAFAGEPSSGTWTLEITDDTLQDMGALHGWGLRIGSDGPCGEPTNTPVVTNTPANTPTNTPSPTPTDTPVPCSACNLSVEQVTISCNLDGTVHWTATVRNGSECAVSTAWAADLQTKLRGGKFGTVRTQNGQSTFPPGLTVLSGDICYQYPPDTTGQRMVVTLDSNGDRCKLGNKTDAMEPCQRTGACP